MIPLLSLALAADPITLDDALRRSADRPAAAALAHDVDAARRDATTAWLGAVGPTLGGTATLTQRSAAVALDTPIGPFVQTPKEQATAGAELRVPVLSPDLFAASAAAAGARVTERRASRSRQELALEAGEAFLDVVVLDARREAAAAYAEALDRRLVDLEAGVAAGSALQVDRLRVQVALADAELLVLRLDAARPVAVERLGMTVGADVEPVWTWTAPVTPPAVDVLVSEALAARPDLAALDAAGVALRRERTAVAASALPRLDAVGSYAWTDQDGLVDPDWWTGGLELTWAPVAGGTRISRVAATSARAASVAATRADAEAGVSVEVAAARSALVVAIEAVRVREAALEAALEADRLQRDRTDAGIGTLTDALLTAAAVRDGAAALAEARVETTRADLRLRLATGAL